MLEDLLEHPERLEQHAAMLADLHERLHHLGISHPDLHPIYVILASSGPVVIDWEAADEGGPAMDVAETWLILGSTDLEPELDAWRNRFLTAVLAHGDRGKAHKALAAAAAQRRRDHHMTSTELHRMEVLAAQEGFGAR
jgi:aminoglycoside phosphotransferase (APT) family kinase protein